MSSVGIVGIGVGLLLASMRGPLVVAPAAWLRWFRWQIETNRRTRIFGGFVLMVVAGMVWAGTTEDSLLAVVLRLWGLGGLVIVPLLVIFPGAFRTFASGFLPAAEEERLPGWRVLGMLNVVGRLLLVYVGVLAL